MNPPELDKLDQKLRLSVHRGRWAAVALLTLIVLAAIAVFAWTIIGQDQRLQASCQFYRDLASFPLPAHPRPPKSTVAFQVHALEAYLGEGCGTPPVNPDLRHWAGYYHVRLP